MKLSVGADLCDWQPAENVAYELHFCKVYAKIPLASSINSSYTKDPKKEAKWDSSDLSNQPFVRNW